MTITSRVSLAAALEDGDVLEGDNLANLIDSYLHLTDTSAQSVASPVSFTGSCTFTNLNLQDIDVSSINFAHAAGGSIAVSGLKVTTILSAQAASFNADVSAIDIYTNETHASAVKCNTVAAGDVTCSTISVSACDAALVSTGRIVVSAISANKIWSSALNVYSALSIFGSSTAVATGDGSATPASVAGFIKVNFNGAEVFLPYYTGS